jgi:hypothetical protein
MLPEKRNDEAQQTAAPSVAAAVAFPAAACLPAGAAAADFESAALGWVFMA